MAWERIALEWRQRVSKEAIAEALSGSRVKRSKIMQASAWPQGTSCKPEFVIVREENTFNGYRLCPSTHLKGNNRALVPRALTLTTDPRSSAGSYSRQIEMTSAATSAARNAADGPEQPTGESLTSERVSEGSLGRA